MNTQEKFSAGLDPQKIPCPSCRQYLSVMQLSTVESLPLYQLGKSGMLYSATPAIDPNGGTVVLVCHSCMNTAKHHGRI